MQQQKKSVFALDKKGIYEVERKKNVEKLSCYKLSNL